MASLFQNSVSLSTWLSECFQSDWIKVAEVGEGGRWSCRRVLLLGGLVDECIVGDVP